MQKQDRADQELLKQATNPLRKELKFNLRRARELQDIRRRKNRPYQRLE